MLRPGHLCQALFIIRKLEQSVNCSGMRVETDNDFGHVDENQVSLGSGLDEVLDSDNRKHFYVVKNLM